jgi:hypothetical protein
LESIGYVLVYFLKGSLPWQGLKAKNAQKKYQLIMEKKQSISIANLCQGCPSQFAEYLVGMFELFNDMCLIKFLQSYCRSLKFDSKPDITYLRKLFRDLYHAQGCSASTVSDTLPSECNFDLISSSSSLQGRLWDWDSSEADNFILGNNGSGGAQVSGGPAGFGSGGGPAPVLTNAHQMGGDNLEGGSGNRDGGFGDDRGGAPKRPPSAATGGTAVISAGGTGYGFGSAPRTAPAAGGVLPPTGAGSWGFGGTTGAARPGTSDAYGGTGVEPLFEQSGKAAAARQQQQQASMNMQQQRPRTANVAGRPGSAGLPGASGSNGDDGMEV